MGDAGFVEDAICCEVADGDNDFGLHDCDELVEAVFAVVDFVFFGVAVVFGAAEDGVGNKDVFTIKVNCCEKFLENFSGGAAERDAKLIFGCSWCFADEEDFGVGVAVAKDDFGARLAESGAFLASGVFLLKGLNGEGHFWKIQQQPL